MSFMNDLYGLDPSHAWMSPFQGQTQPPKLPQQQPPAPTAGDPMSGPSAAATGSAGGAQGSWQTEVKRPQGLLGLFGIETTNAANKDFSNKLGAAFQGGVNELLKPGEVPKTQPMMAVPQQQMQPGAMAALQGQFARPGMGQPGQPGFQSPFASPINRQPLWGFPKG